MANQNVILKVKKLHPNAKLPKKVDPGSNGYDLTAVSVKEENGYIEYKTGLAFEFPPGYTALLMPRSSLSKYDLTLTNSVGLLDQSFRGEVTARFKYTAGVKSLLAKRYAVGDRIIQLVLVPVPSVQIVEADELSETERGSGGYGSSGV